MRNYLIILIASLPSIIVAQAPGCPNIDIQDETVTCDVPCVDLIATYLQTGETTSYEVTSIPYAPPFAFTGGTSAFVGIDDIFSSVITIPFDFCYYGNTYNQLVIGANGLISFDISLAGAFCQFSYTASIPSAPTVAGPYENSIHGAFHDIDPSILSTQPDINYTVIGTAPCRTFVVNFNNVAQFNCNNLITTQQIVIYETTNAIEVYIEDKQICTTWNSGNALIGIQNIGATQGLTPPNRNTGPWSATAEAWRFTPNGTPNYIVEWFDNNGISQGFGDTLNVCTQTQENYTAEITYTNCNGLTISESTTNTVFVDGTAGQIASLGLNDSIQSCTSPITINAANNLDTYLWSTGEITSSISVNQTGNYILEATQGGCNGNDTVHVSIVNANILENDTEICELDIIDLNIEESNTFITWSTLETTDNITVSPTTNTEYWVEISDGITSCRDSVTINVNSLPSVEINGVNDICIGESAQIILTFTGAQPYTVNINGVLENFTNNSENFTITPINTTTYAIDYITDINCQNDTNKNYTLNVNPIPNPIINPSFGTVYPKEEVELTTGNYINYYWYNENNTLLSENESIIVDSSLIVYVIVEDNNGCFGESDNAVVKYNARVDLHVPNSFTPNGDEHNELFVIAGDDILSFQINIFNRWGKEVYSTNNISKFWDGTHNGELVQQGVYTYYIDIIGDDLKSFYKTGIVNVIY